LLQAAVAAVVAGLCKDRHALLHAAGAAAACRRTGRESRQHTGVQTAHCRVNRRICGEGRLLCVPHRCTQRCVHTANCTPRYMQAGYANAHVHVHTHMHKHSTHPHTSMKTLNQMRAAAAVHLALVHAQAAPKSKEFLHLWKSRGTEHMKQPHPQASLQEACWRLAGARVCAGALRQGGQSLKEVRAAPRSQQPSRLRAGRAQLRGKGQGGHKQALGTRT